MSCRTRRKSDTYDSLIRNSSRGKRTLLEQNVIYKLSLTEITSLSADYIWTRGRMFRGENFARYPGIIPLLLALEKPSIDLSPPFVKSSRTPEWNINPRSDRFRKTFDTRWKFTRIFGRVDRRPRRRRLLFFFSFWSSGNLICDRFHLRALSWDASKREGISIFFFFNDAGILALLLLSSRYKNRWVVKRLGSRRW